MIVIKIKENSQLHILYSANENYVRHLAASLCSLCENNGEAEQICFHVISCGITEDSKAKITSLAASYGRTVAFYELGDVQDQISVKIDTRGFDTSILARLFIGSYLPKSVEKVLYLDCDTIVIDRITELFDIDLEGYVLAGVPEPVITKSRRPSLDMLPCDDYYNSGVLLFNLKEWRACDGEGRVLEYFAKNSGRLIAGDQDAINACFRGKIKTIPPKYNYASYNIYYPYRLLKKLAGESAYVSEDTYKESKAHPAIIHYLGEERPWRQGNTHPYADRYQQYLAMTEWRDVPDEQGWKLYFFCFRIFNFVTRPFPMLRYKIIDSLIPAFMRHRAKKLKKSKEK